jgi:mannose-6-phosphate isomerase-like protein (cupin superfamily)
MYVAEGELVLVVDGVDYPVSAGECAVWPSSHAHAVRNDAGAPARAIGFTTETVY